LAPPTVCLCPEKSCSQALACSNRCQLINVIAFRTLCSFAFGLRFVCEMYAHVNFYDRGLFPPAAFHSEGHQDGMGVCLYLALMKRLFGKRITFALLDDVVMSVDAGHRYQSASC